MIVVRMNRNYPEGRFNIRFRHKAALTYSLNQRYGVAYGCVVDRRRFWRNKIVDRVAFRVRQMMYCSKFPWVFLKPRLHEQFLCGNCMWQFFFVRVDGRQIYAVNFSKKALLKSGNQPKRLIKLFYKELLEILSTDIKIVATFYVAFVTRTIFDVTILIFTELRQKATATFQLKQ